MKIRIKYFEGAKKLEKIEKGDWIDLRANKDIFIPRGNEVNTSRSSNGITYWI